MPMGHHFPLHARAILKPPKTLDSARRLIHVVPAADFRFRVRMVDLCGDASKHGARYVPTCNNGNWSNMAGVARMSIAEHECYNQQMSLIDTDVFEFNSCGYQCWNECGPWYP